MIEAGGGGSKCVDKKTARAHQAMVRVRLIKNRSDLVAVIWPGYAGVGVP
jgi:hypothetical protein